MRIKFTWMRAPWPLGRGARGPTWRLLAAASSWETRRRILYSYSSVRRIHLLIFCFRETAVGRRRPDSEDCSPSRGRGGALAAEALEGGGPRLIKEEEINSNLFDIFVWERAVCVWRIWYRQ